MRVDVFERPSEREKADATPWWKAGPEPSANVVGPTRGSARRPAATLAGDPHAKRPLAVGDVHKLVGRDHAPNRSGGRRGGVVGGRDFQAGRAHSPRTWRCIPKGPPARGGSQDKYNSFSPSISVVWTAHCLCHFLYKICQFVHSLGAIRTLRSTPVSPKWKAHLPRFVRHPQPTSRRATAAGRPMDKSCQNIHIPP